MPHCSQCNVEIMPVYRDGYPVSHNEWLHPFTNESIVVCHSCDPIENCISSDVFDLLSENDPFYYR